MVEQGVIEPSKSPWASPIVLVPKKDGTTRFCIDYRRLNSVTKKDSYALPSIQAMLDTLSGASWFCTLDLKSGYWQVALKDEDKEKTAFTLYQRGLWQFKVLPFGLCNAPATFQRLMEAVLPPDLALVYLDDIIVLGPDFPSVLSKLEKVLQRLANAGLQVRPDKCSFFTRQTCYLGHIISGDGVQTDPKKTDAIRAWPVPTSRKQVRSFLGMCSYYRRFIKGFSELACPLNKLTEEKRKFQWDVACQESFESLKKAMTSTSVLCYPDLQKPFILDCDASDHAVGAVLSQEDEQGEKVIAYFSRTLSRSEANYCATRRELLAVLRSVQHFHQYLYGAPFTLRTDQASLA
uniref:RNA-directed DNA polymerase n=2 Tax=Lygus hesperus TaxID=30085 RepID=A0A0A9WGS4_LYGHE